MKKVTIMIPTYNQPQYIEQCVESAMAQDYQNLEIVISDDSTNNKTEKIINEKYSHDPRIKYFRNKIRLGRVANYHHTLYEKATGDYVLNLDGDDWLIDDSYITKAAKILDLDKEIVCVIAQIMYFHQVESCLVEGPGYDNLERVDGGNKYLYLNARGEAPFNHLTLLYRRAVAKKIGFYNQDITWTDTESAYRLICHKKVGFIKEHAGVWRIHNANESKKFFKTTAVNKLFLLEESVSEFYKKNQKYNSINIDNWEFLWKYYHCLEFIIFVFKESEYGKLYEFFLFLSKRHKLFLIRAFPWLVIDLSLRGWTYLGRKISKLNG